MRTLQEELYAAARQDFTTFAVLAFEYLYGRQSMEMNWHIEKICYELEKVASGKRKRLILNLPPRYLKSFLASVAFPLWLLGRRNSVQIMCVSYGEDLVQEFGKLRQAIALSALYREIFSNVRFNPKDQSATRLGTLSRGSILGVSLNGAITGKGCDVLILDDPMKADDVFSASARDAVLLTVKNTLVSRLNSRKTGAIILAMQRLHEQDLTAQILPLYDWKVLAISAIATKNEKYRLKNRIHRRTKGDVIQERRDDRRQFVKERLTLGAAIFEAQYQQNPLPIDGGLITLGSFKRYKERPPLESFDTIVLSVDAASSINPKADYTVISVWGLYEDEHYLLYVYRKQRKVPEVERAIRRLKRQWGADFVLIELDGVGTAISHHLIELGVERLITLKPRKNKQLRFSHIEGAIEQGKVFLPEAADWLPTFERELLGFPTGSHDDQVDSMTQAIFWAQKQTRRMKSKRHKSRLPSPVRQKAPDAYSGGRERAYERSRRDEHESGLQWGFTDRVRAERGGLSRRALGF